MKVLQPEEAAYLAGFIDGEGSLQIQKRLHRNNIEGVERIWIGYSAYLEVGNTDKAVIEYLNELGGFITFKKSVGNRKASWHWRLPGQEAVQLVRQIRQYLRVKAQIADVFVAFPYGNTKSDTTRAKRDELFERAKVLNSRGCSSIPSTTISQESTLQAIGSGSAQPSNVKDDIVCSA